MIAAAVIASGSLMVASPGGASPRQLPAHLAVNFFPAFERSCEEGYSSYIRLDDVTVDPDDGESWDCFGVFEGNDSDLQAKGLNIRSEDIAFVLEWVATYDAVSGLQAASNPDLSGLRADKGRWTFSGPVTFPSTWMLVFRRGECWAGWMFTRGTYTSGSYQLNFAPQGSDGCAAGGEGFDYTHVSVWADPDT